MTVVTDELWSQDLGSRQRYVRLREFIESTSDFLPGVGRTGEIFLRQESGEKTEALAASIGLGKPSFEERGDYWVRVYLSSEVIALRMIKAFDSGLLVDATRGEALRLLLCDLRLHSQDTSALVSVLELAFKRVLQPQPPDATARSSQL